ncbi:hypothetical protein J3458_014480 [Metarhizium acridum]|uniref:uncharacterized protein n=1 Tax=Metarhizium acridum TaxID=92637 RepID=UPI001C6BF227|nr:hypothetical protein J3458_014480 [Metarhizium acridum]
MATLRAHREKAFQYPGGLEKTRYTPAPLTEHKLLSKSYDGEAPNRTVGIVLGVVLGVFLGTIAVLCICQCSNTWPRTRTGRRHQRLKVLLSNVTAVSKRDGDSGEPGGTGQPGLTEGPAASTGIADASPPSSEKHAGGMGSPAIRRDDPICTSSAHCANDRGSVQGGKGIGGSAAGGPGGPGGHGGDGGTGGCGGHGGDGMADAEANASVSVYALLVCCVRAPSRQGGDMSAVESPADSSPGPADASRVSYGNAAAAVAAPPPTFHAEGGFGGGGIAHGGLGGQGGRGGEGGRGG